MGYESITDASGDITGVTAGDGISGGGTSGTVTVALDLMTDGGLEITSEELSVAVGIAENDVAQFAASVVDNDFLKIATTSVEGRSAAEVLSDIAALPLAGGTVTGTVTMGDDVKLVFGAGTDASLEYDENGTDQLRIAGSTIFEDQVQLDKSILVDSTPGDGVFSGITGEFVAGEILSVGECVYLKASDTRMWKAVSVVSGTGLITSEIMCVAVAAEAISAGATGTFLLQGFLTSSAFPTYAIGETLYLPEAEQSSLNVPHGTVPSTDGDFIQVVGWASAANTIFFNPSYTIIEIA